MRYELLTDIGGFLWWIFIKFCSTKLEEEQTKEKWSRNIIVFIVAAYLIAFVTIKIF
jgi:hypothetical protein